MNELHCTHGSTERPRSWRWTLLAIAALALLARLVFLLEMRSSELFAIPFGGAAFFHRWGEAIARGEASTDVYYHAPLYPCFLGALYRVFGSDPQVPRFVQAFLGAAGCALLAGAGRVFFDRRTGIAAGLLLALWPPAILSDALHKKTSLDLFLLLAMLAPLARAKQRPRAATFALAGLALSAFTATRENGLVLAPLALGWIALGFREERRAARARWAACFLAGVLVAPLAMAARNLSVAGELVPGTVNSGANFYIGNRLGASGLFEPLVAGEGSAPFDPANARRLAEAEAGRPLSWREVSRAWWRRGLAEVAAHPGRWLALLGRKCFYMVSAQRWVDDHDLALFRRESRLLAALGVPLRYGLLAPLGLAGLTYFGWRRGLRFLGTCWLALAASLVLFFLVERFRASLLPFLLLFGAHAGLALVRALRAGERDRALRLAGLAALWAVPVHAPTGVPEFPASSTYNFVGLAWAEQGDQQRALGAFERALREAPDNAAAHYNAGEALLALGREQDARAHLETALLLEPAFTADALALLGDHHARHGDPEGALELLQRARAADPDDAFAHHAAAEVLRVLGRPGEAEAAYREALRCDSRALDARNDLARVLAALGRPAEARAAYEENLALAPDSVATRLALAWLLATDPGARDGARALEHAERALELGGPTPLARETLAAARAAAGDFAGASALAEQLLAEPREPGAASDARAAGFEAALAAYRAGRPWTVPPSSPPHEEEGERAPR